MGAHSGLGGVSAVQGGAAAATSREKERRVIGDRDRVDRINQRDETARNEREVGAIEFEFFLYGVDYSRMELI